MNLKILEYNIECFKNQSFETKYNYKIIESNNLPIKIGFKIDG